jgi:hypothetical protein
MDILSRRRRAGYQEFISSSGVPQTWGPSISRELFISTSNIRTDFFHT